MTRLLPNDVRRAALSAGLLASDNDGEVVAAARKLIFLLKKADLDPAAVVTAGLLANPAQLMPQRLPSSCSSPLIKRAPMARHSPHINRCERDFLTGMMDRSRLSQGEAAKLHAILRKVEGGKP